MASINVKRLVAFRAHHEHGNKEAWCWCLFDSMAKTVFSHEDLEFIEKLDGFHLETLHEKDKTITVGVKAPSEKILAVTSEENNIIFEGGSSMEVPAEIAARFRKFL